MDKKDRILVYELTRNARQSFSQLAKSSQISQETVRYRINKLIGDGTVKKFILLANTRLLGYSFYQVFLKLQNARESDHAEIIEYLQKNNCMAWVANLEGRFDIAFIVVVKDQAQLQGVVDEIYRQFGQKVMQKALSFQLSAEFFPRDYLIDSLRHTKKTEVYRPTQKMIDIDHKDMQICLELSQNARASFVDIGTKLKLSADAIAQRVRRMEKEGLITGYTIDLNNDKANILHYKILLRLNTLSPREISSLLYKIREYNRTTALIRMLAEWDYEIDVEVEDVNQVKNFIMELTASAPGIIKDYDILRIVDVPRYNFFPNVEKQD